MSDAEPKPQPIVRFECELPQCEAVMLAQLCKRLGFATARDHAMSDEEAYRIIYATSAVRTALEAAGVWVR